MAIVRMVSKERYEADPTDITVVTDYPGSNGPLYMHTTHRGLVLSLGERNGYDDSDFYATVWNPEKGAPETIEYASTRGWTYPNGADVDATPEARAAYEDWDEKRRAAAVARRLERERLVPSVGRTVTVTKGRKVPIGTTGRVFWFGKNRFANTRYMSGLFDLKDHVDFGLYRIGIETADGAKVFTDAKNVSVVMEEAAASAAA